MFRRASSKRVEGLLFRMNWENNAICKFSSNTGMQHMQIEGKGPSTIIVIDLLVLLTIRVFINIKFSINVDSRVNFFQFPMQFLFFFFFF